MSKEWNDKVGEAIANGDNALTALFFGTYPFNSVVVQKSLLRGETQIGIMLCTNNSGVVEYDEFEFSIMYKDGFVGVEHFYYGDGVDDCEFCNLDDRLFVLKQCETFDEAYTFLKQVEKDGLRFLEEV